MSRMIPLAPVWRSSQVLYDEHSTEHLYTMLRPEHSGAPRADVLMSGIVHTRIIVDGTLEGGVTQQHARKSWSFRARPRPYLSMFAQGNVKDSRRPRRTQPVATRVVQHVIVGIVLPTCRGLT